MAEQELPNALKHFGSEVRLIDFCVKWLRDVSESPLEERPAADLQRAVIEAMALHLRIVLEFLARAQDDPIGPQGSVKAAHFLTGTSKDAWTAYVKNPLIEHPQIGLWNRLSERYVHFTYLGLDLGGNVIQGSDFRFVQGLEAEFGHHLSPGGSSKLIRRLVSTELASGAEFISTSGDLAGSEAPFLVRTRPIARKPEEE